MKKKTSLLQKYFPFSIAVLAGIFLLATGWEKHQPHPLQAIAAALLPAHSLEDSRVVVTAKMMTPEESKKNFGHDFISRGVQPLQLTIENNTPHEYSLSASAIDLPRIEPSRVAFKVTQSALPRSIAYKVAGFFFWPIAIPSTIDSIRVFSHHKSLKKDLKAKAMKDEVLAPYSIFNRVLFVPKEEFQNPFKVTLIDLDTLKPIEFQTTAEEALAIN